MSFKRCKAIGTILLLAFFLLSGFAKADKKDSDNNNELGFEVLRWAADTESGAPYVFQDPRDPSVLTGFEADIIRAIAKELGLKDKHVQNQWDGLIPGLKRNDYHVAINGLEITPDRKEVVAFSDPYYTTYEQIIVREGDQYTITNLSDLVDKKVGTLKASLAERILRATGGVIVRSYDSEANSFKDLANGRLDAVLIDHPVALYYAEWNPQLRLTGQPVGEVVYGIAMRKSDTLLLKKINGAIESLKESGELRRILEYWNMWNTMMASLLDDYQVVNYPHTGYQEYIEYQKKETSFERILDRYLSYLPVLGKAALVTLGLSIISMTIAIILGLIVAMIRVYAPIPISSIAVAYVELVRGTPLLIQLFLIFYGLPVLGIQLSPFLAAITGLAVNYSAYEAENYRAGLNSVPKGQMEASTSLGLSKIQSLRYIILPQAVRVVIPPITNDFISLLKDSSLVSVIAMVELTKEYLRLAATYYDHLGAGLLVAAIYLLIGLPFVKLSKYAESKFASVSTAKKEE